MNRFRRRRRSVPDISVTSMVDVVLLLLFFFMVSTTFNKQTQIKIKLPEAASEETTTPPEAVRLTIASDGTYFLEDAQGMSHELLNQKRDTLASALRKRFQSGVIQPFIISADGKAPHQAVITALEAANIAGFNQISFATESKPEVP